MTKLIQYSVSIIILALSFSGKAQDVIHKGDTIITIQKNNSKILKLKDSFKNVEEISKFCKSLKLMNEDDQKYRGNDTYADVAYIILDSVYKANNIAFFPDKSGRVSSKNLSMKDKIKYSDITTKIISERYPNFTTEKWKKRQEDWMKKQIILDDKNTEQLINIIKERGYPNKNNCKCSKKTLNRLIVFRHSQTKYFDEIRILIEKEYKAKRLPEQKYKLFLDHINGRTGKDL